MILGRGDKRVGLVVDRLRGQQEVVIKALDPAVSGGASAVAGATIMGDGRVVLILDVAALFEASANVVPRPLDAKRRASRSDPCTKTSSGSGRSRFARPPIRATCI